MSLLDPVVPDAPLGTIVPGAHAVNLFALVDGAAACITADSESDPSVRPILHRAGSIGALISKVPLSDYCGPDAARNLSDLAWLAPRTLHHAAVLGRAMQCAPVYPAPFGTLFASTETLTAFMLDHAPALGIFFRAVSGMAEWELKATACLDSRSALESLARDSWPDWAALTPGTRYLRLSRDRPALIAARRAVVQERAARLAHRLQIPPNCLRTLSLQSAAQSDAGERVGRFALLVPLSGADALALRVDELAGDAAEDGITLTLSGPWPPFSFRPDLPRPPPPVEP